jgi:hypothetical protein
VCVKFFLASNCFLGYDLSGLSVKVYEIKCDEQDGMLTESARKT